MITPRVVHIGRGRRPVVEFLGILAVILIILLAAAVKLLLDAWRERDDSRQALDAARADHRAQAGEAQRLLLARTDAYDGLLKWAGHYRSKWIAGGGAPTVGEPSVLKDPT